MTFMLRGAEEACWAHNPKVDGSKPSGATYLYYFTTQPYWSHIVWIFMEDIHRIKGIIN